MIKAGEAGGFLEDTISRMAVYLENTQALKEEIRSAVIYPSILSVVGGAAIIVLLTFVVPRFTSIFADMGQALPLPTVILLAISGGLINYWWAILLFLAAIFFSIRRYLGTDTGDEHGTRQDSGSHYSGNCLKRPLFRDLQEHWGPFFKAGSRCLMHCR